MSILSKPYFHDEQAAYDFLEAIAWPDAPICPHCGACDRIYELKGKSTRVGVRKCGHCRKPFTVKVGTVFESSHVPLHKWLQAVFLMCASKKGISAHQLHRTLEVNYRTAWFMEHRIREAMRSGEFAPIGGLTKPITETPALCVSFAIDGDNNVEYSMPKNTSRTEQSERFMRTAGELGCDEEPEAFESAEETGQGSVRCPRETQAAG
jgi:transposase-like protein